MLLQSITFFYFLKFQIYVYIKRVVFTLFLQQNLSLVVDTASRKDENQRYAGVI